MDPELVKAAVEIGKAAGLSIPFTSIVRRMLGPAADEVAEMWRDQVRVYRYERQKKLLEKVEKMSKDAGFAPQAVPPKILFPLLEGASFEDDEDLHTMWAALLANAASPENTGKVRPGFIAILKEMSPDEATVLEFLSKNHRLSAYSPSAWNDSVNPPNISFDLALLCLDALEAAQLVRRRMVIGKTELQELNQGRSVTLEDEGPFSLTDRGKSFLAACQPPKPKS